MEAGGSEGGGQRGPVAEATRLLCPSCPLGNSLGEKSVIDTDTWGCFRSGDRLGFGMQGLSLAL